MMFIALIALIFTSLATAVEYSCPAGDYPHLECDNDECFMENGDTSDDTTLSVTLTVPHYWLGTAERTLVSVMAGTLDLTGECSYDSDVNENCHICDITDTWANFLGGGDVGNLGLIDNHQVYRVVLTVTYTETETIHDPDHDYTRTIVNKVTFQVKFHRQVEANATFTTHDDYVIESIIGDVTVNLNYNDVHVVDMYVEVGVQIPYILLNEENVAFTSTKLDSITCQDVSDNLCTTTDIDIDGDRDHRFYTYHYLLDTVDSLTCDLTDITFTMTLTVKCDQDVSGGDLCPIADPHTAVIGTYDLVVTLPKVYFCSQADVELPPVEATLTLFHTDTERASITPAPSTSFLKSYTLYGKAVITGPTLASVSVSSAAVIVQDSWDTYICGSTATSFTELGILGVPLTDQGLSAAGSNIAYFTLNLDGQTCFDAGDAYYLVTLRVQWTLNYEATKRSYEVYVPAERAMGDTMFVVIDGTREIADGGLSASPLLWLTLLTLALGVIYRRVA